MFTENYLNRAIYRNFLHPSLLTIPHPPSKKSNNNDHLSDQHGPQTISVEISSSLAVEGSEEDERKQFCYLGAELSDTVFVEQEKLPAAIPIVQAEFSSPAGNLFAMSARVSLPVRGSVPPSVAGRNARSLAGRNFENFGNCVQQCTRAQPPSDRPMLQQAARGGARSAPHARPAMLQLGARGGRAAPPHAPRRLQLVANHPARRRRRR